MIRSVLLVVITASVIGTLQAQSSAFPDGVASGDVTHSSVILWTRATERTSLTMELAHDEAFDTVVRTRTIEVTADTDFTAKLRLSGLEADRLYYYRWGNGTATGETGRFRTAPLPWDPQNLRFAFSGDSDGTKVDGVPGVNLFETLDAIRADNPDFFIYLGDVVFADSGLRGEAGRARTLEEYRQTYHVNRELPALRELTRAMPIYAVWDDHEVGDDWNPETVEPMHFTNGRRAFLEQMPVSEPVMPVDETCADRPMFRYRRWGRDIDIIILDERSCRSPEATEACTFPSGDRAGQADLAPLLPTVFREFAGFGDGPPEGCVAALSAPERTLLGRTQKALLKTYLLYSTARFKFIINEVPIQQYFILPYDRWEGYAAERAEILGFIREHKIGNVYFITTDAHANIMNQVYVDAFEDPSPVATEFIAGPIAATTLERQLNRITGISPEALNGFVASLGAGCWDLDAFGYGLVDVDVKAGTVAVSLKDDHGEILHSKGNPEVLCTTTLGNVAAPWIDAAEFQ